MMTRSEAQVGRKVRGASASPMNVWRMRVRDLCVAAVLAFPLMTPLQAESAAAMDGERVWRWMPPFHIQVPASWRPRLDDGGVGYYQGRHPEAKTEDIPAGMSEAEFAALPFGMVHVGRERPPRRGGTLQDIVAQFEKMGEDEKVSNFSVSQEDAMLGSRPAVLLRVSGDQQAKDGTVMHISYNMVIAREPDADGMFQMAALAGTSSFFEAHTASVKNMLAGAVEDRQPPLRALREITYLIEDDKFKFTFGPAVAADGAIAFGDNRYSRVRVYAPGGSVLHEWGSKLKRKEPIGPDAFEDGSVLAFGPQGRIYLGDDGSWRPSIRVFERDGTPVAEYKLDKETLGERGLKEFRGLWLREDGSMTLTALRYSDDARVAYTLSPEGELTGEYVLPPHDNVAGMPDGGVVISIDASPADSIIRFDSKGQEVAKWSLLGTGFAPLPGDQREYFSVEHLTVDGSGRVYAYDRMGNAIWIYSAEGVFEDVVPEAGLVNNRFEGLVASARGDLLVHDEPGFGDPEPPALRWLENARPVSGAAIAPVNTPASTPAAAPDKRAPELVALATQGKLTVRALRGFGELEPRHDALALALRARNLDLYAADAAGIEAWLVAHASGKQALPDDSIETLQLLALKLREFEPREQGKPVSTCACVDLSGTGQHTVMKYSSSAAPQQVRMQAGDMAACMALIETLPECVSQP